MPSRARTLLGLSAAAATALIGFIPASALASPAAPAHYDHVFVIVEENHSFTDVIGNPAAPNLNALASRYGLATQYYGVTHPSEPNYVALLGGSPFGVTSDDPYYVQRVHAPSLISELDHAHVSWKAYLQSVPHPGYQGIGYPANLNGEPDKDPLYVSKHNAIANFTTSLN
ncbi:MAG TPA: alkaline phosphatase family protein, partial [Streptosporangiaceae bacterium]|nr:alkaline phosphatase family protein [Streptosporangiaceae bacterium]